ncbi:LuxR C-terminal-related transcriptional regulator [Ancylomarina sp. DW003]|nr:LuxR C-terminal-related transcriptional regulator [Ancylomarina sp. DW003]MDE5423346.1 LuxR C-terminal-related transcriptional regulator [Ancylomarina sp. DW003]
MIAIEKFFDPIRKDGYLGDDNYELIKQYIMALRAVSKLINLGFYIIDYNKQEFLYVSDDPLFLSGYEQEEVLKMGYEFYDEVVPSNDLDMLLELNEKGFEFFYNLPTKRRDKASISYDFRLTRKDTGSEILVNHKLTPLILTETGNIWFALCLVSLSVAEKPGNTFITFQDKDERYDYDCTRKQFKPTKINHLSRREKDVLQLMIKGNSACEMSQKLFISEETIKFHKRNIIKKLHVKSAMEAVYIATINKIV